MNDHDAPASRLTRMPNVARRKTVDPSPDGTVSIACACGNRPFARAAPVLRRKDPMRAAARIRTSRVRAEVVVATGLTTSSALMVSQRSRRIGSRPVPRDAPSPIPLRACALLVALQALGLVAVAVFYLVCQIALFVHLRHGISSTFQTLGLKNARFRGAIDLLGLAVASFVLVGNCAIVLAVLLGYVPSYL